MKSWILEPVVLPWIITAGQPGVLESRLLLAALPLPKFFYLQLSAEQPRFPHSSRCPGCLRATLLGPARLLTQPEQRQGHRDGAGKTDPPTAHAAVEGLRPDPEEVPSWGPPCPNFFSHGCTQECSAAPVELEILVP